jgi:uncharacterized protein (DUF2141 family)
MHALTLGLAATVLQGASLPGGVDVSATVTGLRSDKGQVLACLTAKAAAFPKCEKDPVARLLIVPADKQVELDFGPVPSGDYAIALIHDENANGRLDKRLMMPREGFGFSRNAPVGFGPPSFGTAAFSVGPDPEHQSIRMRYLF